MSLIITYSFTRVAINIRRWFEIGLDDGVMEHGSRIELRLLARQRHRGTESAAQKLEIDQPFWRADIFNRLDRPRSSFSAAHFHPWFDGVEPSERNWSRELTEHPWIWLHDQMSSLEDRLVDAGLDPSIGENDADDVRAFATQIVQTAQQFSPTLPMTRDDDFRLTKDVSDIVRLMVRNMNDPADLDARHVQPWVEFTAAD